MNKNILGIILIFGLVSSVSVFLAMFLFAFNNDYVLYNFVESVEDLKDQGLISQADYNSIENVGNEHSSLNLYFDWWWIGSYLLMVVATLFIAYYSREQSVFSFLTMLFFGTMIFLFALSVVEQVTSWVIQDIFYRLLPTAQSSMPMFDFYISHVGIISFVHLLICLLINMLYLKIKEFKKKTNLEVGEVVV